MSNFSVVLASLVSTLTVALGCIYAAKRMHSLLLTNVLRWPTMIFDQTPLGRILNRFSKDVDVVDSTLPMNLRSWMTQLFAVIKIFITTDKHTHYWETAWTKYTGYHHIQLNSGQSHLIA